MLKRIFLSLLFSATLFGQTQSALNEKAGSDFDRADAQLSKVYQSLFARLADAEAKGKLQESQRAWVAFRDAQAVFAADEARGGSMAEMISYQTKTLLTQQRIRQLKSDFLR